ncbi:MAG: hypothetical protein V7749_02365 [Cocleimonas sp.]
MESRRYRVVAVGAKTPDILSKITQALSMQNYEIDTISSLRLGHSIVVICIVEATQNKESIRKCLEHIVKEYDLKLIVDLCARDKYKFVKSDAYIRIRSHHETGIKAYIISELINSGLDIHGLESDTYTEEHEQKFVMNIKGQAISGIESLYISADKLNKQGINTTLATDWKLLV